MLRETMDKTINLYNHRKFKELRDDLKQYDQPEIRQLAKYMLDLDYTLSDFCDIWRWKI